MGGASQASGIHLIQGDITQWVGDAIVNAANEAMLGGGGVDGAIHSAAGPGLKAACEAVSEASPGVRCPTGEARITPASGRLKCKWVIHTVGPIYTGVPTDPAQLRAAYDAVYGLAVQHRIRRIALPAVSCGVYGYPLDEAANIAMAAAVDAPDLIEEITFVLFNDETYGAWHRALSMATSKV